MDRDEVRREVIRIVAGVADLSVDDVSPSASLADLGIDSLRGLHIVAEVEQRYGITIPDDKIDRIRSMQDVFALVDLHT